MSSLEGIIRGEWRQGICYFACPVIWFSWFFSLLFCFQRRVRSTRNDFLLCMSVSSSSEGTSPFEQNRTNDSHWSISHRSDLLFFQVTREIQQYKCHPAVTVPTATLTDHPPPPMQFHRLVFSTVRFCMWHWRVVVVCRAQCPSALSLVSHQPERAFNLSSATSTSFDVIAFNRMSITNNLLVFLSSRNDKSHVIGIYKYWSFRSFTVNLIGIERIEWNLILRAESHDVDEIKKLRHFSLSLFLFSLVQFDIIIIFIFLFRRLSLPSCVDLCVCVWL